MKRFLALIAALLLTSVAAAQYPDFLKGDNMADVPGPHDVESYVAQYVDHNPWSSPSPVGAYYLFGRLCFTDENAQFNFKTYANRICGGGAYGLPPGTDAEDCTAYWCRSFTYPTTVLPWDEDAQAYLLTFQGVEGTQFMALTCSKDLKECMFYQGSFDIAQDRVSYMLSDSGTFQAWQIDLRTHDCVLPLFRVRDRARPRE